MAIEGKQSMDTRQDSVTVRMGVETDAPAYRDLRLEALRQHPTAFGSDYETNRAKPMAHWVERLCFEKPGDGVVLYFAVAGETLIGMCGISHTDAPKGRHSSYLVSMYVRPGWRGQRIAEQLIEACLGWAREHGITMVKLGVTVTNTPAIRCYARCGFQVYGIEPQAIWDDGTFYDELLMARALTCEGKP